MRDALTNFQGGVKIGGQMITNLRYADDTTLICSSKSDLRVLLRAVKSASEKRGLMLNTKKTKILIVDDNYDKASTFPLDEDSIDVVGSFEFMGSIINTKGECSQEIKRRLSIARSVTQSMTKLWKSKLPASLKVRLLKSTVFSVASYGSESWSMKKADKKRLDAFEMWCYRRILRIPWTQKKSNLWILEQLGIQRTLRADIVTRKLSYFGHATRHASLQRIIIQGMMEKGRKRGRPATSWLDDIKDLTGLSITKATRAAKDRILWRSLIRTTPASIYAT